MSTRRNSPREYVKYEDGKLISIKEEPIEKVPLSEKIKAIFNKKTLEQLSPKEIKNKVVKNFSFKSLFSVFIISSLLFIYVYYFTDLVPSTKVEQNISNKPSNTIINVDIDKGNTNSETTKPNENTNIPSTELTDLQQILKISNEISSELYSLNLLENSSISEYMLNRQNRITTMKYLNRMTVEKEDLYIKLLTNKSYFINEDKLNLYEILEQRTILSLKKTDEITKLLEKVSSIKEIEPVLESFNENEALLKSLYEEKLIEILDSKNVSYEMLNNKIIFNIEEIK